MRETRFVRFSLLICQDPCRAVFLPSSQWFDQKKLVLDTLESQLKILVKSIELVSKQRLGKLILVRTSSTQGELTWLSRLARQTSPSRPPTSPKLSPV